MYYFQPTKYVKDESFDPVYKRVNKGFFLRSRLVPALFPAGAMFLIVTQILVPLVFFKTQDTISSPMASTALGKVAGFSDFRFDELDTPSTNQVLGTTTQAGQDKYFYLSIPKLKIDNARVEINEPTLTPDESLGHYANSALPGEIGNVFVYGHSAFPFFYNPKNYKTIFTTLDDLKPGDKIYVSYQNKKYTYEVEGSRTLKPEQVDPLAQIKPKFLNEKTMVLMTCMPAGWKTNRLLVDTVLVEVV